MKNILLISSLFIFFPFTVISQTKSEFFVSINPSTGTFQKIAPIPSIRWIPEGGLSWEYTTYDSKNRRFIFKGLDSLYNAYLMTIEASTGNILYNPPLPNTGDTLDDVFYLHYDTTTTKLYGIYRDASSFPPFIFVSMDQITGNITPISTLIGITSIATGGQYSAFDSYNGWYTFYGTDGESKLFTIDINTGAIIYSPLIGGNYRDFQFDVVTNKMYGLLLSGSPPLMPHTLVSIDRTTGIYTSIATIPSVVDIFAGGMRYSTFDSNNGRYIFRGGDGSGNWNLYSIDVNTGSIISNPPYPLPPINSTVDNVVELQYDNSVDSLYGLHWGNIITSSITDLSGQPTISIFPNPTNGQIRINSLFDIAEIDITNLLGQSIHHSIPLKKEFIFQIKNTGVYLITILSNNHLVTKKIIVNNE